MEDGQAELAWVDGCKLRWFARPNMVTYPSTNRVQCRVALLIGTNALPICQTNYHTNINLWSPYVIGQTIYIFMLWFVVVLLLLLFSRLISAAADWMSAILPHMVWVKR